ncbi:hypothetical protein [Streptomyces sp. NBC_01803]|uniref:hypothetical protein n=1 Tax=Streptomyces sp. NBC_01803 TaxID=2975946 RepID=UPI002DD7A56E|nr:hypothetical protein [Streptomyces sp. NBC_01803]WSA46857.1 hypothetical protein OIE51_23335 [Streptomyces sp. NBC_01803]
MAGLIQAAFNLGMNGAVAGLLTSVPALLRLLDIAAPRLAVRFGPVAIVVAGLTAVSAGRAPRTLAGSTPLLLATTVLARA